MKNFSQNKRNLYIAISIVVAAVIIIYLFVDNKSDMDISESQKVVYDLSPSHKRIQKDKIKFEDFTGSESCRECHLKEYNKWSGSTHSKAGGEPGNIKIVAKFDGRRLKFKDAVVIPKRNSKGDYIFELLSDENPPFIVKVDALVGGGFMVGGGGQSFFSKFPDGTLRFLPFDFLTKEDTWVVQVKGSGNWVPVDESISTNDLINWPPNSVLGSVLRTKSCQNCHGSQIILTSAENKRDYQTHYTTLKINCESCHGPGRKHIETVRAGNTDDPNVGMEILSIYSKDNSLNVCFRCHAIKDALRGDLRSPYLPGDKFEDFFSLNLPMLMSYLYLPDGRINGFGYQKNHLYSDCYVNGSMTCVDCHDPHDQSYRDIFGKKLVGRFDNGQCTDCHASKAESPELHSKHKKGSPGNLCTSCHMPYLQHRDVGNKVSLARSDHVIPIPRPNFDNSMGIKNACVKCHEDKSISELQKIVDDWWGEIKPHNFVIEDILNSDPVQDMDRAAELLLHIDTNHKISQFQGLVTFVRRFVSADVKYVSQEVIKKLVELAKSDDLDIKALALASLHIIPKTSSEMNKFLYQQLEEANDNEEALRLRWSQILYFVANGYANAQSDKNAIILFKKALEIYPYDSMSWNELGKVYARQRKYKEAINSFANSVKVDPYNSFAYLSMAEIYSKSGDYISAGEMANKVLEYDPENPKAKTYLPDNK